MAEIALSPDLIGAFRKIHEFIETVTGMPATDVEIARVLTRYFVLNEIAAHIEMDREDGNIVTK